MTIKSTITICLFVLAAISMLSSQNYIRLTDASGFNTDAYQAKLEAAAAELVNVFPEEYRDSFKVFDVGFYSLTQSFEGGYPPMWERAIAQAGQLSPYFLLFGKQSDERGLYSRFWVEVRLPEDVAYPCLSAGFATTQRQMIEAELETFYSSIDRNPIKYSNAEIYGMSTLQQAIDHAVNCCQVQGIEKTLENTCSADCPRTPEQVANILTSPIRPYASRYIELKNAELLKDQLQDKSYSNIEAEKSLIVDIPGYGQYALTDELNALAIELEGAGASANIVVSYYNEENCAELNEFLDNLPGGSTNHYSEHLVVLDYEGEAPRIFSNIQFGEGAGQAIEKREKSVVFVPVAAIIAREVIKRAIMAGTNVALNVIVEVAIEKYFGHGNDCSWLDAWKDTKISAWSIIIWSVEGAIGELGNDLAMSILAGTAEAMLYLFNTPRAEFDIGQLFTKFTVGFSVSLAQRLIVGKFFYRAYDKFTLQYLADKYDVDGNLIEIDHKEFLILFKAFFLDPRLVGAWELAYAKGLREGLRGDIPTLQMIESYQTSTFSSRVLEWSKEEFITHFEFLNSNSPARERFTQYLDDNIIFLPRSPAEKVEILRLLGVNRLIIQERLGLFSRVIAEAEPASNAREAIALINKALDDVEDAFSGVPKNPNAINMPNIQDGRMYGILDDKFVKEFPDGKIRAFTRKNTIIAESDGSFRIYRRDRTNQPDQIGVEQISKSGQ